MQFILHSCTVKIKRQHNNTTNNTTTMWQRSFGTLTTAIIVASIILILWLAIQWIGVGTSMQWGFSIAIGAVLLILGITAIALARICRRSERCWTWWLWGLVVGFGIICLVMTLGGLWQAGVSGIAFGGGAKLPPFLQTLLFRQPGTASVVSQLIPWMSNQLFKSKV